MLPDDRIPPPDPFLSLGRPFPAGYDVPASATYLYGSDGGGWLLLHHGLDYGSAPGAPVIAVADGQVVFAGDDSQERFGPQNDFYGNLVVLRHRERLNGDNLFSLYGHLAESTVKRGDSVRRGDEIGRVGGTGIALGPHLHLEIRTDSRDYARTLNPLLFTTPGEGRGTLVGRLPKRGGRGEAGVAIALFRRSEGGVEWLAESTSYLEGPVNSSPGLEEDFVFADLPAGDYVIERVDGGEAARAELRIAAGEMTIVTLRPGRSGAAPSSDGSSEGEAKRSTEEADDAADDEADDEASPKPTAADSDRWKPAESFP